MIFTQKRERVVFSKEERETIYIYDKLTNYIDIPDMPLDNNDTERLIRDMVMGKKAYIYGVEWILTVQLICGYTIR